MTLYRLLNCTAISIDSPHMRRDGANYLNLLLHDWVIDLLVEQIFAEKKHEKTVISPACHHEMYSLFFEQHIFFNAHFSYALCSFRMWSAITHPPYFSDQQQEDLTSKRKKNALRPSTQLCI